MVAKILIFFLFSSTTFAQKDEDKVPEKDVDIVLGIDKVEKFDFAVDRNIIVGNSSFLDFVLVPSKREIVLKGLKPGKTTVSLRNTVGDLKLVYVVNITANDLSTIVQELKHPKLLGSVEGLEIGIAGDNVFVGGKIVVPGDIGRVVVVLEKKKYEDVLRLVELSPHTQRVIARKMQEEIQKNQLRDVTVRVINGLFWLEGIVSSVQDRGKAESIAAAYIPDRLESLARRTDAVQRASRTIIQNFIQVNPKKQPAPIPKLIKITTQFVELTKDYNKIFGFKWTPLLSGGKGSIGFGKTDSGQVTTRSSAGSLSGTIANLFPKLTSAKNAGFARIIQSGVVIVKNNFAANINKSVSKNTPVGSGETQRVVTTTGGFDLNITPKILAEEKVELNIGLNVSVNQGDAVSPEQLSNKIKTSIVVKSKNSAVIGGIVVNRTSTDFDKDPFPNEEAEEGSTALFQFIRSKTYTTNRSQFAVFVTPEILESASAGTNEIKRKFRRRRR